MKDNNYLGDHEPNRILGLTDFGELLVLESFKLATFYGRTEVNWLDIVYTILSTDIVIGAITPIYDYEDKLNDMYDYYLENTERHDHNDHELGFFDLNEDTCAELTQLTTREIASKKEAGLALLVWMASRSSQSEAVNGLLKIVGKTAKELTTYLDEAEDKLEQVSGNDCKEPVDEDIIQGGFSKASNDRVPNDLEGIMVNLNEDKAVAEETISGVDKYVDDIIEVLCRKKKSNPIIIGEPGIGKTTVVHKLVQMINNGEVPDEIKDKKIMELNSGLLTAGTRYRGDFEQRLQNIVEMTKDSDMILFIDEFHMFLSAGRNGDNAMSAGEVFKPYLASGQIKLIGATTLKEYHKYIENDKAFERRLQPVMIDEPSVETAIEILGNTVKDYEDFHKTKISNEIIETAVKLSDRYIRDKKLPDKAYMIIDQTASRCKLAKRKIETRDVYETISKITGIDIDRIGLDNVKSVRGLEDKLAKKVIGQEEAVKLVANAVKRGKAGVQDTEKPVASFLFAGPTGVGKTELAKVLNEAIGNSKDRLIRFDMSEYSEPHSISKLIGSPAGYVGYGDGGLLTEAVKNKPDSIILFDEIEKANDTVFNLLLQILDEGRLTDGEGNTVDFKNTIVIMTSNVGYQSEVFKAKTVGFSDIDTKSNEKKMSKEELDSEKKEALIEIKKRFRPELINRIDDIVIFNRLTAESCEAIVKLQLNKLTSRLSNNNITIKFNPSIIKFIANEGFDSEYGARNIKKKIKDIIENEIASKIIDEVIKSGDTVSVSYKKNKISIDVKEKIKDE